MDHKLFSAVDAEPVAVANVRRKIVLRLVPATTCLLVLAALLMVDWGGARTLYAAPSGTLDVVNRPSAKDSDGGSDHSGSDHNGSEDSVSGEGDEWKGIIETRPEPGLTGNWTILLGEGVTVTVVTSSTTLYDPPQSEAYAPGNFVEIDGVRQPDQTILATRLRAEDFEDGEVVVRFGSDADPGAIADKYDLKLKSALLQSANIYLYTTDEDEKFKSDELAGEDGVIWAELNYVNSVPTGEGYKTWGWGGKDEPGEYSGQPAYAQIGFSDVVKQFTGAGITVAVLDTGVYTPHEQFAGRLLLPSLDVISDDTDPSEIGPGLAWGHGTHVSGIIAQMAPEATILPIRVLDPNGRGNTFLLAYAIEWAVNHGAQVINLSLGTNENSQILRDVIARTVEQGVVIVAAVGNGNSDVVQYPAGYPGVIGVTAVDANGVKATFANYGTDWVDLAAPGVGIMSTMIAAEGPGYASWTGTSMSTAFVSGAAALVLAKPQIAALNPVIGLLTESGTDIDGLNPTHMGKVGRLLAVDAALGVDAMGTNYVWVPLISQ